LAATSSFVREANYVNNIGFGGCMRQSFSGIAVAVVKALATGEVRIQNIDGFPVS
jgi:hypothetical protein